MLNFQQEMAMTLIIINMKALQMEYICSSLSATLCPNYLHFINLKTSTHVTFIHKCSLASTFGWQTVNDITHVLLYDILSSSCL